MKRRQALRDTWLNRKFWKNSGFEIHVVFLIGCSRDGKNIFTARSLQKEISEYRDILRIDFDESKR